MVQDRSRKRLMDVITWGGLGLYLLFTLIPIAWFLLTSIKPPNAVQSADPFQPFTPTLQNYITVFSKLNLLKYVLNSAIICICATIFALIPGILASYSFARLKNKITDQLSFWMLSTRMLPSIAVIIPLYTLLGYFGLLDTYLGLIIVYVAANIPYVVWMMMSFLEEIPVELDEAAEIDGCSKLGVLWNVILPIAMPGIVSTGIFVFIMAWSEFLFAVIVTSTSSKTLPVAIASFVTDRGIEWGNMTAAGSVLILPMMVLFYSIQRYLVRGLSFGAVKG